MIYDRRIKNMEKCTRIKCLKCGKMFELTDNVIDAKSLLNLELLYCPACLESSIIFKIPSHPQIDIEAIAKAAEEKRKKQLERDLKNSLGDV